MTRPIYIEHGLQVSVRAEHSALHIVRGEQAPTVIGVRNISRVVAPMQTRFSPSALALCISAGIAIAFIDDHGRTQGILHGATTTRSSLPSRLAELLRQPSGPRIYRTWWKAMESRCRCRLARRLRIAPDRHRARAVRAAMEHAARQRADGETREMLEQGWRTGLDSLAGELLHQAGFDARAIDTLWPAIDFRQDLIRLLDWALFLPRITALTQLEKATRENAPRPLLRAKVISSFEAERPRLENRAWSILHRLDVRLMELGLA